MIFASRKQHIHTQVYHNFLINIGKWFVKLSHIFQSTNTCREANAALTF